MRTTIHSAADHPEWIPVVGRWHWDEWGHHDPDGSIETWTRRLRERTNRDRVPAMFLAVADGEPVGSAVLVEHDMDTRMDLSPWLAGIFVRPPWRGQGIAAALCRHAADAARDFGIGRLYLYTNGAEGLYAKLGWRRLGEEDYEGRRVTLMSLDLERSAARRDRVSA